MHLHSVKLASMGLGNVVDMAYNSSRDKFRVANRFMHINLPSIPFLDLFLTNSDFATVYHAFSCSISFCTSLYHSAYMPSSPRHSLVIQRPGHTRAIMSPTLQSSDRVRFLPPLQHEAPVQAVLAYLRPRERPDPAPA